VADIYSVVCNSDQARALAAIAPKPGDDFFWATEKDIENGELHLDGKTTLKIARTAKWIL